MMYEHPRQRQREQRDHEGVNSRESHLVEHGMEQPFWRTLECRKTQRSDTKNVCNLFKRQNLKEKMAADDEKSLLLFAETGHGVRVTSSTSESPSAPFDEDI